MYSRHNGLQINCYIYAGDVLGPKWSARLLKKSNVWFQIVMAKKFQELRNCIDPPELNKALKTTHYQCWRLSFMKKALKRKDCTQRVLEDVLHEQGTQAWRLHTTNAEGCPS